MIRTLEFHADSNYLTDPCTHVRVEVSLEDYRRWSSMRDFVVGLEIYCAQQFDYRCEFIDEEGNPTEFRQDVPCVVVTSSGVSWEGLEKHGDSTTHWDTDSIAWDELDAHFSQELTDEQ